MAGASFFFGVSATMAPVVIMRPATDAASWRATRTTFGYVADYGEEQPLWWVLRLCPGDRPLIIPIEDEGGPH